LLGNDEEGEVKMINWEEYKKRLIDLLREKSFRYSDNPPFTLISGRQSFYYFNCKPTTLNPEGKELVGKMVFQLVRGQGFEAIGGLELGATPISGATSLISQLEGEPIGEFIIRKEKKDHGDISKIEGDFKPGQKAVVVDEVITTGGSTITAIEAAIAAGLIVTMVVVIVDRQEGGRENILKQFPGIEVQAMVLRDEVLTDEQRQKSLKPTTASQMPAAQKGGSENFNRNQVRNDK